jgi:hypothetical protein
MELLKLGHPSMIEFVAKRGKRKQTRDYMSNVHEVPNTKQTPWSWVVPEKLTIAQPLKKLKAFYGTRMYITVFIRATHPNSNEMKFWIN